ncbi:acyl-CoA dehydrogenase family protein [Streptomyces albipurpureus]|uniref:Acyl-CoA dehydrogenase n=1 Tax=Streptomyces albipurpureus TaxID=2897419 RepID=A0ABT0UMT9_9ACTN|nr:acyl-CoA dehydrogenase [Streptomyces sp. CWNU-1]MCM2389641.1 acyl-CoA dehydrogenase [Streptomyces sp. CWNU-1]
MSIALFDEHIQLAEAAGKFANRNAPVSATRELFAALGAGGRPGHWDALVGQGLHSVHIDEEAGGGGGGVEELAVIVEQAGRALLPGPFVPTVMASAVVAGAPTGPRRSALLREFAGGALGAVLLPGNGITARRKGSGGWTLSGWTTPVLGLMSAEIIVVGVELEGRSGWFHLSPSATGLTRTAEEGVDLTRDVGRLELDDVLVSPADQIGGVDDVAAAAAVVALYSAEASGLIRWCLDTAVEYVKVREQFGKPVGSFQAVKHKAARLMITAELAAAVAWDAARSVTQDSVQQRLATAGAAVVGPGSAVDAAVEAVSLLGGIGFTWEHDVHLYWRRAISVAGQVGPHTSWSVALGKVSLITHRDFSLNLPEEDTEFRAWVAGRIEAALALPEDTPRSEGWSGGATGPRRTLLADAGLVAPHWPKPWGLGASAVQQVIVAEEFTRRGLVQPSTVIGEWALPTILAHGTDGQKERFATPTLRGETVWCQLFSEPGAGSDLAGLSTKAVKTDGGWRLDGQKVWTSSAHEADWGICLARTDRDAPKHRGISYFLVDMRSPGIEIRPLKQATGASEFNEVFMTDVFVPDDCLVGRPGEGWRLTATTLANERLSIGTTMRGPGDPARLRDLIVKGSLAAAQDDSLRVLGRAGAFEAALSALNLREALRRVSGGQPGAGSSIAKVAGALIQRENSATALALLGPEASLDVSPGGLVADQISLPNVLIGGGTVEIQLNVIAERILGLPR